MYLLPIHSVVYMYVFVCVLYNRYVYLDRLE